MEKGTMGYILCHVVENMFNGCRTFFFVLVNFATIVIILHNSDLLITFNYLNFSMHIDIFFL